MGTIIAFWREVTIIRGYGRHEKFSDIGKSRKLSSN